MREITIQHAIREALNKDGRVRLMRNSVGFDKDRRVRYGLGNGSPDLIGVLRDGRVFAVEVKAPNGRMSPEQVAWWIAARTWSVQGGVAFSVDDALALLEEACR